MVLVKLVIFFPSGCTSTPVHVLAIKPCLTAQTDQHSTRTNVTTHARQQVQTARPYVPLRYYSTTTRRGPAPCVFVCWWLVHLLLSSLRGLSPSHVVWSRAAWRSRSSQPRIPRQSVSKPSLHGLIPHPHVRSPSDACRLLYYDDDDRTLISGKPMDVSVDYDRVDQRVSGSPPSRWCVRRILVLHGHGPVAPLRARVAVLASHPLPGVRPGYAMQYLDGDMPLSAASMTGLSAGAYENKSPRIKKGGIEEPRIIKPTDQERPKLRGPADPIK
jgi:hypothetical protein